MYDLLHALVSRPVSRATLLPLPDVRILGSYTLVMTRIAWDFVFYLQTLYW